MNRISLSFSELRNSHLNDRKILSARINAKKDRTYPGKLIIYDTFKAVNLELANSINNQRDVI
jgi:hypothetical protein